MTTSRRSGPLLIFAAAAAGIYAVALYLRTILPNLDHASLVSAGLAVDLAVVVPLLGYLLLVRRAGMHPAVLVPLTVIGLIAATRIIPKAHAGAHVTLELMIVAIELTIVSVIAWKATRAVRRYRANARGTDDVITALRATARDIIYVPRAADAFAYELAMFYYGLVAWWRAKPRHTDREFTCYQRDAYPSVILGLFVVLAIELVPVHLLLHSWQPWVAWLVTGLSVYSAIWMFADLQAFRFRPMRIEGGTFLLRVGMRWEVALDAGEIETIRRIHDWPLPDAGKGVKAVAIGAPEYHLRTHEPVDVHGPYGMTKRVRDIYFNVDDPQRFERLWPQLEPPGTLSP